jgi:hypothetical protein
MWLNIKWYDGNNVLLRTDGEYGNLAVTTPGVPSQVRTILDPTGPNTKIYEAHYAMTQEWANQLLNLGYSSTFAWADQLLSPGYPSTFPLSYDRVSGAVNYTLGQLASQAPGTERETFHCVLNNHVAKDNRIPTYGMTYDEAAKRNALPVPAAQYGSPTVGGTYNYWDTVTLNPPAGAAYATIDLLYQSTSWEYIQFLYLANNRQNAFLADEGVNLLKAWLNTGMSEPFVMASTTWGTPPASSCVTPGPPQDLKATAGRRSVTLNWAAGSPAPTKGYRIYYDQAGKLLYRAGVSAVTLTYKDSALSRNTQYCYLVTAWNDCNNNGVVDAGEESTVSNQACATAK